MTTKIHAAVNENGKLQKVQLTPGQQIDVTQASILLEYQRAEKEIADKAYVSEEVRKTIQRLGVGPAIPSRKGTRKTTLRQRSLSTKKYHRTFFNVQNGSKIESLRFEHRDRFLAVLALYLIITWRSFFSVAPVERTASRRAMGSTLRRKGSMYGKWSVALHLRDVLHI